MEETNQKKIVGELYTQIIAFMEILKQVDFSEPASIKSGMRVMTLTMLQKELIEGYQKIPD